VMNKPVPFADVEIVVVPVLPVV